MTNPSSPPQFGDAAAKLRENAESLRSWVKSFDEYAQQASDPLFGRGYGIEKQVHDLFTITSRLGHSVYQGLLETASALEALPAPPLPPAPALQGDENDER